MGDVCVHPVDVHGQVRPEPLRQAGAELIGIRLLVIVCEHGDVRRSRYRERSRIAPAIRIGVRGIADVDRELLIVPELAEGAENARVSVIAAVSAPDHRRAVALDIPGQSGAWSEIVAVAALRHVDVGDGNRED